MRPGLAFDLAPERTRSRLRNLAALAGLLVLLLAGAVFAYWQAYDALANQGRNPQGDRAREALAASLFLTVAGTAIYVAGAFRDGRQTGLSLTAALSAGTLWGGMWHAMALGDVGLGSEGTISLSMGIALWISAVVPAATFSVGGSMRSLSPRARAWVAATGPIFLTLLWTALPFFDGGWKSFGWGDALFVMGILVTYAMIALAGSLLVTGLTAWRDTTLLAVLLGFGLVLGAYLAGTIYGLLNLPRIEAEIRAPMSALATPAAVVAAFLFARRRLGRSGHR